MAKASAYRSHFWERIAFRVSLCFLAPVLACLGALYCVVQGYDEAAGAKGELGRLWATVHLGESRAHLQLETLRHRALGTGADAPANAVPQMQNSAQLLRLEAEQLGRLDQRIAERSGLAPNASLSELVKQFQENQVGLSQSLARFLEVRARVGSPEAAAAYRELERLTLEGEAALGRLRGEHELYEEKVSARLHELDAAALNQAMFFAALISLLGLGGGLYVAMSLAGPMARITARLREIAAGEQDLALRVPPAGRGEFATLVGALNQLLARTESVIGTVANASEVVRSTTERVGEHTNLLTVSAAGINKNMMEQSMNLDEATNSLGSIDDLIHSSGESTRQAASLSKIAMDRAHQGGGSVQETILAMEKIEESSGKVEELVSSITDIASQTNLLAINAAIEATKAGEHGKGFAVVAEEVRKLAERSRRLTAEVTNLIGESSQRVKAGVSLAKGAGVSLDGIIKDVEAVASLIQRIAASASKQSESSSMILDFMQRVSANVRTNLDELQEVNRATELTVQEVVRLNALVGQLNGIVEHYDLRAPEAAPRSFAPERSAGLAPLPAGAEPVAEDEDTRDPSSLLLGEPDQERTRTMEISALPAGEDDPAGGGTQGAA